MRAQSQSAHHPQQLPDPKVRPTLTVPEGGAIVGFGRAKAYQEAARYIATDGREGLPVVAFGRSLKVPTATLLKLLGIEGDHDRDVYGSPESRREQPDEPPSALREPSRTLDSRRR